VFIDDYDSLCGLWKSWLLLLKQTSRHISLNTCLWLRSWRKCFIIEKC
jgi:hypothetical protein